MLAVCETELFTFQLTGDAVYVFRFRGSSRAALVPYQLSLSMFKTLTPSEKYHQYGYVKSISVLRGWYWISRT